jgi:hypothetical protein
MVITMAEILSFEATQRRYDGEWLIIAYTELDDAMGVIAGEVLAHSTDETEIYRILPTVRGRDVAIEYVGQVPDDLAFIL